MTRRGFTLVEVLVAMVILSVGLLALAKMSVVYVRASANSQQLGLGTVYAQSKMEELRRYATPNQPGTFAVYDFSYLVATTAAYTSVADPPGTATLTTVPGLLSGSASPAGATATTTNGTVYEVLYDNGTHGDVTASDGVFTNSDTIYMATGTTAVPAAGNPQASVDRRWTVQPIALGTRTDYARLTVRASWTDVIGGVTRTHETVLESMAHRRQ